MMFSSKKKKKKRWRRLWERIRDPSLMLDYCKTQKNQDAGYFLGFFSLFF